MSGVSRVYFRSYLLLNIVASSACIFKVWSDYLLKLFKNRLLLLIIFCWCDFAHFILVSILPTFYEQLFYQYYFTNVYKTNWKQRKTTRKTLIWKTICKLFVKLTPWVNFAFYEHHLCQYSFAKKL